MAVETGKDTNQTSAEQGKASLTKEQREKLAQAMRPVNIANGFRVLFSFAAVIFLVLIYFVGKHEDATWFAGVNKLLFDFLTWDIILMLVALFAKIFFVAKYNRVARKCNKGV